MRSIKPGRGPSFLGGIGSIAASVFGVFWTIGAASMGAPFFFPLFGIVFIGMGIAGAVYSFKNATSRNRYSAFDITEDGEEIDPLNDRFGGGVRRGAGDEGSSGSGGASSSGGGDADGFCPYCGAAVKADHRFCKRCGKYVR